MTYNKYVGEVAFDKQQGLFVGNIVNTPKTVIFYGNLLAEMETRFEDAIAAYEWHNDTYGE